MFSGADFCSKSWADGKILFLSWESHCRLRCYAICAKLKTNLLKNTVVEDHEIREGVCYMPVFDFNATPDEKKPAECTYTVIRSNENEATIEKPMMILDNKQCKWEHHSCGVFTNPIKRTSFEFQQEDGTVSADILKIDARFVSLLK